MSLGPKSQRQLTRCSVLVLLIIGGASIPFLGACADALNPSFVETFFPSPDGSSAFATLEPPPGHIPIIFENDARLADDVFIYLIQGGTVITQDTIDEIVRVNPGVNEDDIEEILNDILLGNPTNLEELHLPPRVRMVVNVTNGAGGLQRLEFIDGLRLVRNEDQIAGVQSNEDIPPDLDQNTNNIYIVQCDVASIQIVSIQVFVPVDIRQLETVFDDQGGIVGVQCVGFISPRFDALEADEGYNPNTETYLVLRNYDPRNYPPPLDNIQCGAVVVLGLSGTLGLPFREVPPPCLPVINPPADSRAPAYFVDNMFDTTAALEIPGRYSVSISIQDE